MIKEKHTLTNPYNHHALSRYIDVYEVTTDGCSSSPMSGYKGTECTLVDQTPAGYGFDHWNITGATLTGNNFILNNDVTAQGVYTAIPVRIPLRGVISRTPPWIVATGGSMIPSEAVIQGNFTFSDDAITAGKVLVTSVNNATGYNMVLNNRSFYTYTAKTDHSFWPSVTASGLGRDIHITAISLTGEGPITADTPDVFKFTDVSTADRFYSGWKGVEIENSHANPYYLTYTGFDLVPNRDIYIFCDRQGSIHSYADYSASFSGYYNA